MSSVVIDREMRTWRLCLACQTYALSESSPIACPCGVQYGRTEREPVIQIEMVGRARRSTLCEDCGKHMAVSDWNPAAREVCGSCKQKTDTRELLIAQLRIVQGFGHTDTDCEVCAIQNQIDAMDGYDWREQVERIIGTQNYTQGATNMIVTAGQSYQLPSEGSVQGVLAEVVDQGLITTEWNGEKKTQHKCLLTFEITEEKQDGENQERLIVSRQFTASLDERGNLRKFLEGWRGRSFTADELKAFDLASLVGANAILSLSHNTKGDRTYCNIASAARLLAGMPKITVSENYLPYADRMAKRNAKAAGASNGDSHHDSGPPELGPPDEDEIPF